MVSVKFPLTDSRRWPPQAGGASYFSPRVATWILGRWGTFGGQRERFRRGSGFRPARMSATAQVGEPAGPGRDQPAPGADNLETWRPPPRQEAAKGPPLDAKGPYGLQPAPEATDAPKALPSAQEAKESSGQAPADLVSCARATGRRENSRKAPPPVAVLGDMTPR